MIRTERACGLRAPSGVGETIGQNGPDVSGNKETTSVVLKKQEETRTLLLWDSGFKYIDKSRRLQGFLIGDVGYFQFPSFIHGSKSAN